MSTHVHVSSAHLLHGNHMKPDILLQHHLHQAHSTFRLCPRCFILCDCTQCEGWCEGRCEACTKDSTNSRDNITLHSRSGRRSGPRQQLHASTKVHFPRQSVLQCNHNTSKLFQSESVKADRQSIAHMHNSRLQCIKPPKQVILFLTGI